MTDERPNPLKTAATIRAHDEAMGRVHDLKTWPEFFQAVKRGEKTAELRPNDRDFRVGDVLNLHEWVPARESQGDGDEGYAEGYTGDHLDGLVVTHVLTGMGIEDGFVMLSFQSPDYAATQERLAVVEEAAKDALEGIRYTRQYVGEHVLPPNPGWSWYDATLALCDALGIDPAPYIVHARREDPTDDAPACCDPSRTTLEDGRDGL